jgi:hypothetical protein
MYMRMSWIPRVVEQSRNQLSRLVRPRLATPVGHGMDDAAVPDP